MRVFEPTVTEKYQWIMPVEATARELLYRVGGYPLLGQGWEPPRVDLITESDGRPLSPADMPWYASSALVLGARAVKVLASVIDSGVELLPLSCDEQELWLLNVLHVVDALDEDKSSVLRMPSDGRIIQVNKPVFRLAELPESPCFKVASLAISPVYVTDSVVRAAEDEHLTGVQWRHVWTS